jgi:phosphoribosylformylglycinamidine synthase
LGSDGLRHSIPPTLLISAIGVIDDVSQSITMDLKEAGNIMYLVGDFSTEQKPVPDVPSVTPQVYQALHQSITNGLVRSAHDISEGGLAVTAAEMCIGGRLGMELNVEASAIFNEVNGCLLVEVTPANKSNFESQFKNLPINKIGSVSSEPILKFGNEQIEVEELVKAFNTSN